MDHGSGYEQTIVNQAEVGILEQNGAMRDDLNAINQQKIIERDRVIALKMVEPYLDGQEYNLDQLTAEIRAQVGFITAGYVEIGRKLLAIKAVEGHGNFQKWLDDHFPLSPRQARNFMLVALKLEQSPELKPLAQGGISKALCLLDLPVENLAEFKEDGTIDGRPLEEWQLKTAKELAADIEKLKRNQEKIIAEETKGLRAERDSLQKKCNDLQKFAPVDDATPEWCLTQFAALSKAVRDAVALRRQFIYDDRLKDDLPTQSKIESEFSWMRKELDSLEREWIDTFTPEI